MNLWGFVKRLSNKETNKDEDAGIPEGWDDPHENSLFFAFRQSIKINDPTNQFKAAAKLMTARMFDESISAYKELASRYPSKRCLCETQIGHAFLLIGNLNKALDFFLAAKVHGADSCQIDDEVWHTCQKANKCDNRSIKLQVLQKYLILFPDGKYTGLAKNMLHDIQNESKLPA